MPPKVREELPDITAEFDDPRELQRLRWRTQKRNLKIARGLNPQLQKPPTKVACVHCKSGRPNQRSGLCSACYWDPEIIVLYPRLTTHRTGGGFNVPKPGDRCEPTPHRPGTAEKVEVLAARLEAGLPLWHPLDAELERKHGDDYQGGIDLGIGWNEEES